MERVYSGLFAPRRGSLTTSAVQKFHEVQEQFGKYSWRDIQNEFERLSNLNDDDSKDSSSKDTDSGSDQNTDSRLKKRGSPEPLAYARFNALAMKLAKFAPGPFRALLAFFRGFTCAYFGKALAEFLFAIVKRPGLDAQSRTREAYQILVSRDTLRFGMFLGTLLSTYEAIFSLLRGLRQYKQHNKGRLLHNINPSESESIVDEHPIRLSLTQEPDVEDSTTQPGDEQRRNHHRITTTQNNINQTFIMTNGLSKSLANLPSRYDKFIAGIVAGCALLIDNPSRRSTIALYVFVRAMDVTLSALQKPRRRKIDSSHHQDGAGINTVNNSTNGTRKRMLEQPRERTHERRFVDAGGASLVGRLPHQSKLFFGLVNMPIIYGFLYNPSILGKGYYRWILWMGHIADKQLENSIRVGLEKTYPVMSKNTREVFYPHSSMYAYALGSFLAGMKRASKVYLPVHVLPVLFFQMPRLQRRPLSTTMRVGHRLLLSCLFLSSYQMIVKLTMFLTRNTFGHDRRSFACLAGFLTCFACFWEKDSRVNELMLYCAPKAITATLALLHGNGIKLNFKHAEVVFFSIAVAAFMCCDPEEDLKPTYRKLYYFLFPKNPIEQFQKVTRDVTVGATELYRKVKSRSSLKGD